MYENYFVFLTNRSYVCTISWIICCCLLLYNGSSDAKNTSL